ncbi:unnamed protein product [Nesidiocoris tenuis]|uniref:RNA-directed DNA polymerase n=1 Tax=Nesidiocoris tenuis TaxID=355587 RepID=A0A6H5GF49_9HEMI|nr:unnamed protein product [Nesidiocoris tenuis]
MASNSDILAAISAQNASIAKLAQSLATLVKGVGSPAQSSSSHVHVSFEKFDDTTETFQNYIDRLQAYFKVKQVAETEKADLFVSMLSPQLFALLKNLLYPATYEAKTYTELKEILGKHLNPAPLVIPSRHAFINRKQREGESISQYISELRKLASFCKYNENILNIMLRDVFVSGLRSKIILDRLFEEDDPELDKTISLASAIEKASEGTSEILSPIQLVNKVETRNKFSKSRKPIKTRNRQSTNSNQPPPRSSSKQRPITCLRCGIPNHKAPDCKVKNLFFNYCKMNTHALEACLRRKFARANVKRLEDIDDASEGESSYSELEEENFPVYSIQSSDNESSDCPPIFINTSVNGYKLRFELDCGTKRTIIPWTTFQKIIPGGKPVPAKFTLGMYNRSILHPMGTYDFNVTYNGITKLLTAVIVEKDLDLLFGREWMRAFGIAFKNVEAIQSVQDVPIKLNSILEKYNKIFSSEIGTVKNFEFDIKLKPNSRPVFQRARPIPFALRKGVEEELDRLVRENVLEKVDYSEWSSPVVPIVKPTGSIRLCGDYSSTVNPQVEITQHPFPGFEEAFQALRGGKRFTVLDVRSAFLHLPVSSKTSEILTLNTHRGLYRPKRLMFGTSPAPAVWQKFMESILKDAECTVVQDDVIITGRNDGEHLKRLEKVLQIFQQYDIKLNQPKCKFFSQKVKFLGYSVDSRGIHKTTEKIDAILKTKRPSTVKEVKAFLGLVSFYGRFFPHLASVAKPLYDLTRKAVDFEWTKRCEDSFEKIKKEITSERVLVHYDSTLPITVAVDASPYGLGAVLSHVIEGQERPIAFASRVLSDTEQRYSQIDKEALALKWGIFKFFNYLYGRRFTLITDHRPLLHIFGSKRKMPLLSATRMLHYSVQLQIFNFDVQYRKSEQHSNADALSRLPVASEQLFAEKDYTSVLHISQLNTLPITAKEIEAATLIDPELKPLYEDLRVGRSLGANDTEFSLHHGCIFYGIRVYIPKKFRHQILQELHQAHIGVVKMKGLARSYVYWPKINSDIESTTRNCQQCSDVARDPKKVPTHSWEAPDKPWERLHLDHAGPFLGHMFLLVIDAYSKWPEVHIVKSVQSSETIRVLDQLFSSFGLPEMVVSDNGTSFTSHDFQSYMKAQGIKHITSAPNHPSSNGQVERFVHVLKQKLRALRSSPGSLQEKLNTLLFAYRRAPHAVTNQSPARLMFGRDIRTRLDLLKPSLRKKKILPVSGVTKSFGLGEKVAVRVYNSPNRKWEYGSVISRDGLLNYTVDINGILVRRHVDQMRRAGENINSPPPAVITVPKFSHQLVVPASAEPALPTSSDAAPASRKSRYSMAIQTTPTKTSPRQSLANSGPEPIPENVADQQLRRSERLVQKRQMQNS